MAALVATPDELAAIVSVDAAFNFGNVDPEVKAAVEVVLGNPQDLRDLALISDQEILSAPTAPGCCYAWTQVPSRGRFGPRPLIAHSG